MSGDFAVRNWALLLAAVLAAGVLLFIAFRHHGRSPHARLGAALRRLKAGERKARAATAALSKSLTRLDKLRARAASVRPRLLDEASAAVEDARVARKNADDLLLIARNDVRKAIVEEFPPKRHAALRRRYLAEQPPEP
jgi:hypothetical protein